MSELEVVRMELYKAIEFGDKNYILKISRNLDNIIVNFMNSLDQKDNLKNPA